MRHRRVAIVIIIAGLLFSAAVYVKQRQVGDMRYNNSGAYKEDPSQVAEKQDFLSVVVVGDIMLSRNVAQKIKEYGDPNDVFTSVKWFLQSGDLVFGNLENPITTGREIDVNEMILRADPWVAPALKETGFDLLSLANNHISDFGTQGLLDTLKYLDDGNISYAGAGRNAKEANAPKYIEINGVKLAFLAFTDPRLTPGIDYSEEGPSVAFLDQDKIAIVVNEVSKNADFTIVYLHGGTEYIPEPDKTLINYAYLAIDSGADLVIGSHPHVVQKIEQYQGKHILYSLGNFVFDQLWSEETREGIIAKISISENKLVKIEFLPIRINNDCFPEPLNGERGRAVMEKLELEVKRENTQIWDAKQQEFMIIEQYTFYSTGTV